MFGSDWDVYGFTLYGWRLPGNLVWRCWEGQVDHLGMRQGVCQCPQVKGYFKDPSK